MNKTKYKLNDILLLILVVLVATGYLCLNKTTGNLHVLATNMDGKIPFFPAFAIPYLLFLPLFWGIVLYSFLTKKRFRELAWTIIVIHVVSYLFYIFYQTEVLRPQITGAGFLNDLVRFIYRHDAPYNCFPSLHTSLSTVMALYFVFIKNKWAVFFAICSILIILSTLFVKQHYIPDVIGGLILAVTTFFTIFLKKS